MNHPLPYEVNCSILFTELPLLQRPAAVKQAGFDGVEFWWPFEQAVPADKEIDAFVTAIENAGVQLVGLNFFAGDMAGGDRGLVSWPARSAEFRDNIDVTVGIGERLGCKAFNALYGNRVDDASPKQQDELGAENLALAAKAALLLGEASSQVEIVDYAEPALWRREEERSLAQGYNGLRICVDAAHEAQMDAALAGRRIKALCTHAFDAQRGRP